MKKTIVVAIPGIGTKQRHFSVPLENDIRKHAFGDEMLANFQLIELLPFKESISTRRIYTTELRPRMILEGF
jgi:hypothetical protein